ARGSAGRSGGHAAKGAGKSEGHSLRWWTDVAEVCPLSGFPIALLPYPPFKLQAVSPQRGSRETPKLVDGPYLVLSVLCSWRFEVLGKALTVADVNALDLYMKRCKLGPFRLGRALELLSEHSPEAHKELEEIRFTARRRLEGLKHIQRVRLTRGGEVQPAAEGSGRVEAVTGTQHDASMSEERTTPAVVGQQGRRQQQQPQ
ncbi:unnamed protein product, partial [Polarella glacialis]